MERRFQVCLRQLMEAAVVDPQLTQGMAGRLRKFVKGFAPSPSRRQQGKHLWEYHLAGLVSNVKRKNAETVPPA